MKKFMTLTAVLAVLATPTLVFGQCYNSSYYPSYSYYTPPVVVKEIIKEVAFVAAPVLIPTYFTGYVPPAVVAPAAPAVATATATATPAAASVQATAGRDDKILEAIAALGKRMDAMEARIDGKVQQDVPPPNPAPVNAVSILRTHCASCHTEGKTFNKAGKTTDFVLFKVDGTPAPLRSEQIRKTGRMIRQGAMPLDQNTLRPTTMGNDEYTVVQDYLDAMKATN